MSSRTPRRSHSNGNTNVHGYARWVRIGKKFAFKISNTHYTSTVFGKKFTRPMWVRGLLRYGVRDINRAEQKNYLRYFENAPENLRESFPRVRKITRLKGKSVLVMDAVRDFDGAASKTLAECDSVTDPRFWKQFDSIVKWMVHENVPFLDWNPWNFVVKRVDERHSIPVLIDYKSATAGPLSIDFSRYIPFFRNRYIRQSYAAVKRRFSSPENSQ